MNRIINCSAESLASYKPKEGVTIAVVCAVMAIGILAMVTWKLFVSSKGSVAMPGGFKVEWAAFTNKFSGLLISLKK